MTHPGIRPLTYDEAVALLPDGDSIHTLFDSGSDLISDEWPRERVLELLGRSNRRATIPGHPLVAWLPVTGAPVYIETRAAA